MDRVHNCVLCGGKCEPHSHEITDWLVPIVEREFAKGVTKGARYCCRHLPKGHPQRIHYTPDFTFVDAYQGVKRRSRPERKESVRNALVVEYGPIFFPGNYRTCS